MNKQFHNFWSIIDKKWGCCTVSKLCNLRGWYWFNCLKENSYCNIVWIQKKSAMLKVVSYFYLYTQHVPSKEPRLNVLNSLEINHLKSTDTLIKPFHLVISKLNFLYDYDLYLIGCSKSGSNKEFYQSFFARSCSCCISHNWPYCHLFCFLF